MKRILILATVAFFAGATSCTDGGEAVLPPPVPETTVRLEGAIGSSTRAVIGSGYEKDLEVSFARSDETAVSAETYGAWSLCDAVRSGGTGNRAILFTETQLYPTDGRAIRFQGYYPASTAEVGGDMDAGTVTFTIDGATDIMATGCITGTTFAPLRTCLFHHLLTQIQLVCYSDRADQWGEVTGIEAVGIHTRQQLVFSAEHPILDNVSSAADISNIPVQDITDLLIPQVTEGQDIPDAQGYILIPALYAGGTVSHPLHLQVTTTKDGRGNISETVSDTYLSVDGGFLTGRRHVITLFFTEESRIKAEQVSIAPWVDQEQGELPI